MKIIERLIVYAIEVGLAMFIIYILVGMYNLAFADHQFTITLKQLFILAIMAMLITAWKDTKFISKGY